MSPVGLDKVWIVGDTFISTTVQQYFLDNPFADSYARTNMEVLTVNTKTIMGQRVDNPLSRVYNNLVSAMKKQATLPKLMVIVLEDDIIRYANYNDFGVTALYGRVIDYLASQIRQAVDVFKHRILPKKAIRHDWPQIVWIAPTQHENYHGSQNTLRKKFGAELDNQLRAQPYMHVINLSQLWRTNDQNLVDKFSHDMTPIGYATFWQDVDLVLRFANQEFDKFTRKQNGQLMGPHGDENRRHGAFHRAQEQNSEHGTGRDGRQKDCYRRWKDWQPTSRKFGRVRGDRFILPRPSY